MKAESPFQIQIKTKRFGLITLDVLPDNKVVDVKKQMRRKVLAMFEGLDVDLASDTERELIFKNKLLEDGRTLSDYNIVKDSRLVSVGGLDGGAGKRKKDDAEGEEAEVANRSSIPDLTNLAMQTKPTDSKIIKDVIELPSVDVSGWLESMSVEECEELLANLEKYKKHTFGDTSLRSYSVSLPDMKAIEDCLDSNST